MLRAKIVLAAATGQQNKEIADELGTLRKTVALWRRRFAQRRLAGIEKDARARRSSFDGQTKTHGADC